MADKPKKKRMTEKQKRKAALNQRTANRGIPGSGISPDKRKKG